MNLSRGREEEGRRDERRGKERRREATQPMTIDHVPFSTDEAFGHDQVVFIRREHAARTDGVAAGGTETGGTMVSQVHFA